MERVGVVGSNLDCWRVGLLDARSSKLNRDCNNGDLLALGGGSPLQKTRKKGGRRGLRPWPLRCLSQFLP